MGGYYVLYALHVGIDVIIARGGLVVYSLYICHVNLYVQPRQIGRWRAASHQAWALANINNNII